MTKSTKAPARSRWTRPLTTVHAAGLVTALAMVLAVSGCTGTTAPAPIPTAATGSTATVTTPSPKGSGNAPSPTSTGNAPSPTDVGHSGRTVTAATPGTVGQSGAGGLDPITRPAPSPADVKIAAVLPGMYGLSQIGGVVNGHTVAISTSGPCDFPLDLMRAGQWRLDLFAKPHPGSDSALAGHTYAATMAMGKRFALLDLDDSPHSCSGSVRVDSPQQLTLSGAATHSGTARYLPVKCSATQYEDGTSTKLVFAVYSAGPASFLAIIAVPGTKGTHKLNPQQGENVGLVRLDPAKPALPQATTMLKALIDPTGVEENDPDTGMESASGWDSTADPSASVTITSGSPLAGTVTAKLVDPDNPSSKVSARIGFACDQ